MDATGSARGAASAPGSTEGGSHAVRLRGIRKSFFGVLANEDIDLEVRRGEVFALLGENGAGKSTLCSILAGLYRPDAGEISVEGHPKSFHSPRDALAAGIGMVYQHFRLVDSFTVAENLALGDSTLRLRLSSRELEREAEELCSRFGLRVDVRARIWELSVGEQQRVEIIKLLRRGVGVLILDEPTAVLTPPEVEALFRAIQVMRDEGKSVLFVSHKLREVLAVSDRIAVLRAGRKVGEMDRKEAEAASLARLMVGRDLRLPHRQNAPSPGAAVLSVEGLRVQSDRGYRAVVDASFDVRSGEILGIAGVAGNGQRELADAVAGLRTPEAGRIVLNARDITRASPADRIRRGLAYIPEDRIRVGVASGLRIEDNLILKSYKDRRFARGPFLSSSAIESWTRELQDRFDIRGGKLGLPVSLLSGGNLQRAILARELSGRPLLLVAASPTRGLDVGATEVVRSLLLEQRDVGTAVLLISEDLDELQALSDRIVVIYEGALIGEMDEGGFDAERIGLMMSGQRRP